MEHCITMYWVEGRKYNMNNFQTIKSKCNELTELAEALAKETTAIEDGTIDDGDIYELDDIQKAMQDIAFEIMSANSNQQMKLSEGSIDTIIKWSGIMDLVLQQLRIAQTHWKTYMDMHIKANENLEYEKEILMPLMASIGIELGELMNKQWQFINDNNFYKDLYNRKSS